MDASPFDRGPDDGTDRANPAPCAARDYLQRDDLAQKSLLAPFLEQLEEALGGLNLSLRYAAGFDFARVADLSVLGLLAIEPRLKRVEALSIERFCRKVFHLFSSVLNSAISFPKTL